VSSDYIEIVDWDKFLRYAQHPRCADWRPPLVSIGTAAIEDAEETLTPAQLGKFILLLAAYARAPLVSSDSGPKGPRRLRQTASRDLSEDSPTGDERRR
jgi:hypothetical protein